jgi:hypothetical protein
VRGWLDAFTQPIGSGMPDVDGGGVGACVVTGRGVVTAVCGVFVCGGALAAGAVTTGRGAVVGAVVLGAEPGVVTPGCGVGLDTGVVGPANSD